MAKKNKPETAADRVKQLQNNYVDLTKTGPLTYRELAYLMGDNRPYTPSNSIVAANQPRPILENLINSDKGVQYIQSDYGNSMFDPEGYATEGQLEQLNDIRAENQPWYAQIGAGLAKGVVLAGTTFLDGTLGLILGGAEAIAKGDVSRLWDNDFSRAMQSVNEWSEEVMPNYYSREELEEPWYKNIFTANWLGDKFLKNLGFSVGAIYSGGVYTAGLKALKIPSLIGKVLKSTAAPKIVQSAVGATLSAVNEGRIEALNNSNDWQDLKMQELDDLWGKEINKKYAGTIQSLTDEYYRTLAEFENTGDLNKKAQAMALGAKLQQVQEQASAEFENRNSDQRYRNIAGRIAEDRLKMGNMDLLMNIPILTASNIVQFTKFYARGFNTARKAGVTGSIAEGYAGKEFSKLGAGTAIAKAGLSEGTEEISQKAASLISGNYYSTDVNNYRKSQFDKNASQETLDWTKAFATGINETVNDASSWEEFTIGALTGFMGIPMFRGMKNAEGKAQSPIYLEGGAREAYRNYKKDIERSQEIANYLNSRVQSPEFQNYYRGIVRHNKYQNDMNQAVMDDDEFDYKNAEYAQFVSDINMFDNAGRLQDLKDYISNMYDVSDEELEAIIDKTTSKDADGKSTGPFIDKNGNRLTSTEEGKQEMRDKLTKEKDSMMKTINNYRKTKDNLDSLTGGVLTNDQLSELTWMSTQIDDWNDRVDDMIPLIKRGITDLISNRRQDISQILTDLAKSGVDVSSKSKENTALLARLESLLHMSDKQLKNVLTNPKNKDFVEGLAKQMDIFGSETIGAIDTRSIKNILRDIPRIGEGIKLYNDKLSEYLKSPEKLAEDQAKTDKEAAEAFRQEDKKKFRDKVSSAQSVAEFRAAFEEEEDEDTKNGVLADLIDEGNKVAKNYKEISQYDSELSKALNSLGEDEDVVQDAMSLWKEQYDKAEDMEQLGNMNSVFINNEQAFLSDSEGDIELADSRFQRARYALQRAMSKVNNDIKFKDRFSEAYREPANEPVQGKGVDRDEIGNSRTPTIPPVNTGSTPTEAAPTPVGNITANEVAAENSDTNRRVETRRSLDQRQQGQRRYYRPAVPELHIDASKEGDFRPFDVVVAEREPGKDFSEIYNYLRDNGAFDYVNSGKLKAGQTLLFMIDPEFEQSVEGKPWHTAPTVFLTTEDGQVVGSLDEGASIASFEGLEGLVQKVREEYQASRQQTAPTQSTKEAQDTQSTPTPSTSKFYATPKTKVSKIMVGRVPYTSEERSLADIPGVVDSDTKPMFGIIRNVTLTTNEKVDDRLIIKPVDMAQKEGRLYLLVPNAAGTYSPVAVRVKHFNTKEFNLNDITIAATPIGKEINSVIDRLADSKDNDDVTKVLKDLNDVLYARDLHIDYFSSPQGEGIRIVKVQRDENGDEVYVTNKEGKKVRVEERSIIYFQSSKSKVEYGGMEFTREVAEKSVKEGTLDPSILDSFGQQRDIADIRKDILNALLRHNLPLQVSASKINDSGYNNKIIKSNILTSNLREAKVIDSWFITDYFDNQGKLQRAISPAPAKPAPRGGGSAVRGTRVVVSGTPYIVDLKSSIAIDEKTGEKRAFSAFDSQLLIDMAWAQETFGDATESSMMTENKVITPKGAVLDRNTGKYLTGEEAQRIKDKIAGRDEEAKNRVAKSKKVVAEIYENQKKVDKTRTDSNYYYILEDDGQYHKYDRVHSRLGDNWLGEKTESENSRRALEAGTAVDKVIRDFFTSKETPVRPETLSEGAFIDLITKLTEIKSKMEQMGETFLANNIVLFHKYADGTRVAGEVDILSVDKNGNFKIYDVKTSKYSFSGKYFNEKSPMQRMSTKDYYTLQLSAYQNLFESQYGIRPTRLAILPFVLSYGENNINSIIQEQGIPITYNPAVNVPLASTVQAPETSSNLPIFDSTIETMNPENRVLPENAFEEGGEIGYYEKDGKLYTGYLKKIGEVEVTYGSGQKDMVPIHVTKVRDRGFGKGLNANSEYLTVFPNGKAISTRTNDTNDNHAAEIIMKALSAKPEKVLSLSNEKTKIHNPRMLEELDAEIRDRNYNSTPQQGGAGNSIQKNDSVNQHDDEFEDDLLLREVDSSTRPTWNKEKGLKWLRKVLPQLSEQDRVKVVEGLIQVAENGPVAWGMFSNGIVTLSDIAAEGTEYHEAFHVVFNLMLTPQEKELLFEEARQMYGNKSYLDLEEDMAEGFREYVMSQEKRSLGRRILDFFKNLFAKVTHWKYMKPSLTAYYQMINQGRYRKYDLSGSSISRLRQEEYTSEMQSIKDKAIADGTFMKAPNGNPTNLNERQWLQVRTKAFKDWFGDWINNPSEASKVVDENGEPLVVYHGSPVSDFNIFKKSDVNSGYYFTSDKEYANAYGNTRNFFLNIKNIKDISFTYKKHNKTLWNGKSFEVSEPYYNGRFISPYEEAELELNHKNVDRDSEYYKSKGFDGIKGNDSFNEELNTGSNGIEYVVFSPNQIKSATSNTGEFSSSNDDIRYRVVPNSSWLVVDNEIKQALETKGWTQEKFNSISQEERDQAVECVAL